MVAWAGYPRSLQPRSPAAFSCVPLISLSFLSPHPPSIGVRRGLTGRSRRRRIRTAGGSSYPLQGKHAQTCGREAHTLRTAAVYRELLGDGLFRDHWCPQSSTAGPCSIAVKLDIWRDQVSSGHRLLFAHRPKLPCVFPSLLCPFPALSSTRRCLPLSSVFLTCIAASPTPLGPGPSAPR